MKKQLKKGYENFFSGKSSAAQTDQKIQSYLGILSHANQYNLTQGLKNAYWVREKNSRAKPYIKKTKSQKNNGLIPKAKEAKAQWPL